MEQALKLAIEVQISFDLLDEGLRAVRPQDVAAWAIMLANYEADPKNPKVPNPYEMPATGECYLFI